MASRVGNETQWGTQVEDNLCEQLLERACTDRTPDFLDQKLEHFIPVLVYGTLKIGGYFHNAIDGYPYLGDAMTQSAAFTMQETESYPVAHHITKASDPRMADRGKLYGEVFVIDPKALLRLDQIEDNGRMYTRKKLWVKLLNQGQGSHNLIQAWVYVGVPEYWKDVGDMVQDYPAKNSSSGKVYEWTPKAPKGTRDAMWTDDEATAYHENAYGYSAGMNDGMPF